MINESIERLPAEVLQGFRDLLRMTRSHAPSRTVWDDSTR